MFSVKRTTNVEDMSEIGKSYHMPSFVVNGMSVEDVHHAIEDACDRARKGDGPTLLDIRTYRYKGHSMSDPQKYRTKDEVEDYKQKDPITQVLKTIEANKLASEKEGYYFLHPFDGYLTIQGTSSLGFEIFNQLQDFDYLHLTN